MSRDNLPVAAAFVGNPNCGKTTLFNAFTGAKLKVANWPGVTVERVEGETSCEGRLIQVIDTPGVYSLTSYTIEEIITRKCIEEENIDVIINVVDASSLERNLYLTLQLLELGKPVVMALNMIDIVQERGMKIDQRRLSGMLGNIPVVPVSARKRSGLDMLMRAAVCCCKKSPPGIVMRYTSQLETKIRQVETALKNRYGEMENLRWHAIKMLEYDEEAGRGHPLNLKGIADWSCEKDIISQKYNYIDEVVEKCLFNKEKQAAMTDRADKILTHPVWGVPVFLGIMALVFFLTFTVGDFVKGYFETALEYLSAGFSAGLQVMGTSAWLTSLVVDGIVAGVGGILTFLPNIFILFLALAFLEDSGYMARVAYVMNEIMDQAGLSGKAFLPMLLGFGCTVPAVMATRTLAADRDRRRTILVTPFMSCSAKLPIYILFAQMFFSEHALPAAYSLYLIGLLSAVGIAYVVHKSEEDQEEDGLLIELPEYKMPNARTVAIYVWEKVRDYLTKAGTTIFAASVVLWFVLNMGPGGIAEEVSGSFAAMAGRFLVPVLQPAGLGSWQIAVALISGLSAKEVVVSSFSVLYGIGNINSAAGMAELSRMLSLDGFGPANAYALMIFCLMYTPCVAAVGVIRRETKSFSWTAGMVVFQLVIAWVMAVLVYQVGNVVF